MRDEQLEHYATLFQQIENRHGVYRAHGLTFDRFLDAPEIFLTWIEIYFANPALFIRRRKGPAIPLVLFLAHPLGILSGALLMDEAEREAMAEARSDQLLPRQKKAAARIAEWFAWQSAWDLQECDDISFEKRHAVERRGDRYVESFHAYHPPIKWKTRGAHVKH